MEKMDSRMTVPPRIVPTCSPRTVNTGRIELRVACLSSTWWARPRALTVRTKLDCITSSSDERSRRAVPAMAATPSANAGRIIWDRLLARSSVGPL
jgi:hypothetical protein